MQKDVMSIEPPPSDRPPPQYPIESVDNALKLLLLMEKQPEIRLTQASQFLGVASSTAHRLLAMLQYRGFLRQDAASKAYRPGPALTSVAFSVLGRLDIGERTRPALRHIHNELGETVHVGVLEGTSVRFVEAIESVHAVRVSSRVGKSIPAHCTSTGKAMLAELSNEELHRLFPREELSPVTSRSLISRTQLEAELAKIRKRGFALSQEESEDGVSSVAVTVPNSTGAHIAINCAVPLHRMDPGLQRTIAAVLKQAAGELGQAL